MKLKGKLLALGILLVGTFMANTSFAQSGKALENKAIKHVIENCDIVVQERSELSATAGITNADGSTSVEISHYPCGKPKPNSPVCGAPIRLLGKMTFDSNGDIIASDFSCP